MKVTIAFAVCLVAAVPMAIADPPPATRPAAPSAKLVLQEYVAAWNLHEPTALEPLLDAQSVHEDVPAGFRGTGPDQIKAFAHELFMAQPDLKWRLTTIVESGNTVAAEWTWTSTYSGDGPNGPVKAQKISARGAAFVVVEGGRIRRFVDYYDFASAFAAPTGSGK